VRQNHRIIWVDVWDTDALGQVTQEKKTTVAVVYNIGYAYGRQTDTGCKKGVAVLTAPLAVSYNDAFVASNHAEHIRHAAIENKYSVLVSKDLPPRERRPEKRSRPGGASAEVLSERCFCGRYRGLSKARP
jgi:hypothetical protein